MAHNVLSRVDFVAGATNVYVPCRDAGDEFNNANGTSSTTCKVFEAVKYITAQYQAEYVWRVGDDAYLNLTIFFEMVSLNLFPKTRLYLGKLRKPMTSWGREKDLLLEKQPALHNLYGTYKFGQYMVGYGWALSWDVADFLASVKIPPRLTWCEDVIVGFWLNPFDIEFFDVNKAWDRPPDWEYLLCNVDTCKRPQNQNMKFILIHYMSQQDWDDVYATGALRMPVENSKNDKNNSSNNTINATAADDDSPAAFAHREPPSASAQKRSDNLPVRSKRRWVQQMQGNHSNHPESQELDSFKPSKHARPMNHSDGDIQAPNPLQQPHKASQRMNITEGKNVAAPKDLERSAGSGEMKGMLKEKLESGLVLEGQPQEHGQ